MLIQRSILFICAIAGLVASSCAPLYLPNVTNTPLLTGKGELQGAVHAGASGIDPQFAYAVTDNVGLKLNASFSCFGEYDNEYPFAEMGAGYFKRLGDNGLFEIYGGYGYRNLKSAGVLDYYTDEDLYDFSADLMHFSRFFVQPTVGATSEYLDVGFTPRFVILSITDDYARQTGAFFEPSITAKIGYKYVRIIFQVGASTSFSQDIPFDYQPLTFSVGIQATLNRED